MMLGIVVGQVVATRKDENLTGCKLLIVQPCPYAEEASNNLPPIVAVDTVGAGVGETVLYVRGSVAPRAMRNLDAPVDTSIVAIVDRIDRYQKGEAGWKLCR